MNKLLAILSLAICLFACTSPAPSPTLNPTPAPDPVAAGIPEFTPRPSTKRLDRVAEVSTETRTPEQLAQAACRGADGVWRCKGLKAPLMAAGSSPIIPSSWTVSQWYIDPQNSSTCASDSNSGTSSTCGANGVGPLATFQELNVHRWGCVGNPTLCPRIRQNTTLTFLSSHTTNADPVYLSFAAEAGAIMNINAPLSTAQTVCTGTLSGVTNFSYTTPSVTTATLCAQAAVGNLVIDTTASSSYAWAYKNVSGTNFNLSTPCTANGGQVKTWANGDAYTVYAPVQVDLASVNVQVTDYDVSFDYPLQIRHITALDPGGVGNDTLNVSYGMAFLEAASQRAIETNVTQPSANLLDFATDYLPGGIQSNGTYGAASPPARSGLYASWTIITSLIGGPAAYESALQGVRLDSDNILEQPAANAYVALDSVICNAYLDTGTVLNIGGTTSTGVPTNFCSGSLKLGGPGTANIIGQGRFPYPSGVGGAAGMFVGGITLQANGQTLGCVTKPSAATSPVCNTTISATNLDSNLGATSGCLGPFGGGQFCNFGP